MSWIISTGLPLLRCWSEAGADRGDCCLQLSDRAAVLAPSEQISSAGDQDGGRVSGEREGGDSDELGEVKQPTPDRLPRVRHPCAFLNFPLLFLGTGGG